MPVLTGLVLRRTLQTVALATAAFACATFSSAAASYSRINKLFDGGTNGGGSGSLVYHTFRIPSIINAGGNVLLAFCEGRVNSDSDWGNINLVYKRSTDNGATWSDLMQIEGVGSGAWTNPTAVYEKPWTDHPNGRVHFFFNWHSGDETSMDSIEPGDRKTYYTYSDDNGITWAVKQDLTATLKPSSWAWDAVGPGIGIQKIVSPNIGRVIVPATRRNFHTDDHGATWAYTFVPTTVTANTTGESTIVECLDGMLLRNDRATTGYWSGAKYRWVSYGQIGNFPAPAPQNNLPDPRMEASILRYNMSTPDRILFLNSDSTSNRCRMKVRISLDDGLTWPYDRWLYVGTLPDNHATIDVAASSGKGGYSSMTVTGDDHVAVLVEVDEALTQAGVTNQSIDFHKFNLEWIVPPNQNAPVFTVQPISTTVNVGGTVSLTATAIGVPAPTYQWYKEPSILLSGKTDSTLVISNVQAAEGGSYFVTALNSVGVEASAAAVLTVNGGPSSSSSSSSFSGGSPSGGGGGGAPSYLYFTAGLALLLARCRLQIK